MAGLLKSQYLPNKQKGYAHYNASTVSYTIDDGDDIPVFSVLRYNDSDGITKNSDTSITLKAGKRYKLTADFGAVMSNINSYVQFQWHDGTSYVGSLGLAYGTGWNVDAGCGYSSAVYIVTATSDVTLSLKAKAIYLTYTTNTMLEMCNAVIEELDEYQTVYTTDGLSLYSTTEIDTGKKWHDGKAIYRRCLIGSRSATGTAPPHGVNIVGGEITGVDTLVSSGGEIEQNRTSGSTHNIRVQLNGASMVEAYGSIAYVYSNQIYAYYSYTNLTGFEPISWDLWFEYTKI